MHLVCISSTGLLTARVWPSSGSPERARLLKMPPPKLWGVISKACDPFRLFPSPPLPRQGHLVARPAPHPIPFPLAQSLYPRLPYIYPLYCLVTLRERRQECTGFFCLKIFLAMLAVAKIPSTVTWFFVLPSLWEESGFQARLAIWEYSNCLKNTWFWMYQLFSPLENKGVQQLPKV